MAGTSTIDDYINDLEDRAGAARARGDAPQGPLDPQQPRVEARSRVTMDQYNDLFIRMPMSIRLPPDDDPTRQAYDFIGSALRAALREAMIEPEPPPPPELPNAEKFPTLAATGFIFAEAIDLAPVTRPARACPTCGRLTERVEALT